MFVLLSCHTTFVVEEFSTLTSHPITTMKTANSFYWTFVDTLIINVATIAAIVVGVCQFLIRAFNENNGPEKVRKVMQTVLRYVATFTVYATAAVADPAPVPVRKVAQKRAKPA